MKQRLMYYVLMMAAFLTVAVFASYTHDTPLPPLDKVSKEKLSQRVEAISMNKFFDFAGEEVPTKNFDARERLEREILRNAYYHSSTLMNLKRANRYFPTIERILAEHGVPQDFKFLAVAESDLTNATSPAGAKGFWQFMKGTGKEYGLEVNNAIDERFHLEKATVAACKYLKSLKERFGTWTMAAAAYNMGGTRLKKESTAQRSQYYYDLNLNQETSRYVFRIVALKEIMSNPETYGFYLEQGDLYNPLDDYAVVVENQTIENLGDYASKFGISYRQLKIYNPWMKSSTLPNSSQREYKIKIPKSRF